MATPVNGPISMFDVQSTFGLGYNLNAYRGQVWYTPNSLQSGTFPSGQISLADFYNKTNVNPAPPSPTPILYSAAGTYTFVVPLFRNSFSVEVWGAGGGGGSLSTCLNYGTTGGTSSFSSVDVLYATGGTGGQSAQVVSKSYFGFSGNSAGAAGSGGTGVGGTTNLSGSNGVTSESGSTGGGSPNGGAATAPVVNTAPPNGNFVGGGGGGWSYPGGGPKFHSAAGGAGGGGYSSKTYSVAQLPAGTVCQVVVGAGGINSTTTQPIQGKPCGGGTNPAYGGGVGANGGVKLNWT